MSVDVHQKDPLSGEEIIRVSLEIYEVHLQLTKSQIQIGSDFEVRLVGHDTEFISPGGRIGQISCLWRSTGSRIEDVLWDENVTIKTDHGIEIFIPAKPGGFRGSILSPAFTPEGKATAWEDF